MLFRSTLLFLAIISTLCVSPQTNALTLEELASQMKKNSARLDKLEQENARLKAENASLKAEISKTKEQVDSNTVTVETVSESYGSIDYEFLQGFMPEFVLGDRLQGKTGFFCGNIILYRIDLCLVEVELLFGL